MCSNGFEFVHEVRDVWKRVWCTLRTGILKRVEFGINVQRDRVWSGLRDAKQTEMKNPDPVWSISENRKRVEQQQQRAPHGACSSKSVIEKVIFLLRENNPTVCRPDDPTKERNSKWEVKLTTKDALCEQHRERRTSVHANLDSGHCEVVPRRTTSYYGSDLSQYHIGMNKHAQSQQGQNPNFISKSIQLHRTLTRQPGMAFKPSL